MDCILLAQDAAFDIDTLMWILSAATLPLLGWGIHMTWLMMNVKRDTSELVKMHRKPDEYGFGTGVTNDIIQENTRAMQALVHYIRWLAEKQTGEIPPPPIDENVGG